MIASEKHAKGGPGCTLQVPSCAVRPGPWVVNGVEVGRLRLAPPSPAVVCAGVNREHYMRLAFEEAEAGFRANCGGPFGCVIVRHGEVIARGHNCVTSTNDPTAHAEITAIRGACRALGTYSLEGCDLYTSCEPCPMCLAAIYWARIPRVYYGNTRADAAAIGFADDFIYQELSLPISERSIAMQPLLRDDAQQAFRSWASKTDKVMY